MRFLRENVLLKASSCVFPRETYISGLCMALPLRKAHFSWHRHRFLRENIFSKLHIALSLGENALPKALISFSARKRRGGGRRRGDKEGGEEGLSVCLSVCLTACRSVCFLCLSVCLSLSVCPCLSVCLSVFLSVEGRRGGREGREGKIEKERER